MCRDFSYIYMPTNRAQKRREIYIYMISCVSVVQWKLKSQFAMQYVAYLGVKFPSNETRHIL